MTTTETSSGFTKDVVGYCDPISVVAGNEIRFKLSSETPGPAKLAMVRLISGDDRPHGTGLIEEKASVALPDSIELEHQQVVPGSYAIFTLPAARALDVEFAFFPTLVSESTQTLFQFGGVRFSFSEDGYTLDYSGFETRLFATPKVNRWHQVKISSALREIEVTCVPKGPGEIEKRSNSELPAELVAEAGQWYLACERPGIDHFNGKIDGVVVRETNKILSSWDFSRDISSDRVFDNSGNSHNGYLKQTPTRAVKGISWDGSTQRWKDNPSHYSAVHFHQDDITNADWDDTFVWKVPAELPSGQYALKINQGDSEDYVMFFVRPGLKTPKADVLYLVPSASYLAYANHRMNLGEGGGMSSISKSIVRNSNDAYLLDHREVGYSLYEHHDDGSGVHFSSRHRPILNMKPKNGTWAFNADTHITAWLETREEGFDVLTDEDLHNEGYEALKDYRVVITGTHPEYWSTDMLDSFTDWLERGGRLMYMGGNGFYWRIAYHPEDSGIIEVRRSEDGVRAWIAAEGEYYHQFTGEYGGLWRRLGRPPNQLVGVGFAAQGFDGGTYYRVKPGALDPRVSFIVEGLDTAEDIWGNFGNQGGGAAGEEIDRWDDSIGSPAHAIILASSENHRPGMLRVKEELFSLPAPEKDSRVRADMTFFETAFGGAVFSTGSISYAGSLAHNDYDNNIARITNNVLDRFIDPEPFSFPD